MRRVHGAVDTENFPRIIVGVGGKRERSKHVRPRAVGGARLEARRRQMEVDGIAASTQVGQEPGVCHWAGSNPKASEVPAELGPDVSEGDQGMDHWTMDGRDPKIGTGRKWPELDDGWSDGAVGGIAYVGI